MANDESESTTSKTSKPRSKWKLFKKVTKWGLGIPLAVILLYLLIAVIGLIPVNNGFESTENGIEVFVVSNAVHADIVMPIKTEVVDWSEHFGPDDFSGPVNTMTHVAIGWGDRGFFLETPTWADLKASVATKALLLPSESCMHVRMTNAGFLPEPTRSVKLSEDKYERLVEYIRGTMQTTPEGKPVKIPDQAYGSSDTFYEATGSYHVFNTCNCWVGGGLKEAGVRVGWLTPLPKTVYLYFP